jgi:hypothetical protein
MRGGTAGPITPCAEHDDDVLPVLGGITPEGAQRGGEVNPVNVQVFKTGISKIPFFKACVFETRSCFRYL